MQTRPSGMGLAGLVSIHSPTVREGLDVITASLQTSDTGGACSSTCAAASPRSAMR